MLQNAHNPKCDFKCDKEAGCSICQNSSLANEEDIDISYIEIASRYVKNPITKAKVSSTCYSLGGNISNKTINIPSLSLSNTNLSTNNTNNI
mgnify:CR=1 FL=1